MNWTTAKLVEVASIERKGIDPSAIESGTNYLGLENIESGGRIIGRQKVLNGELASTKFSFGPEHILYGKLRPYLAKIALPDFEGVCSTDIVPIKPGPKIDRRFLAYYLRQPSMVNFATSRSTGANLPRLSPRVLAEFDVPLPPLEEQRRIATILEKADMLRCLRERSILKFLQLKTSTFVDFFGDLNSPDCKFPRTKVGDIIDGFETGKNLASDPDAAAKTRYRILKISAVTTGTFDARESKPLPVNYLPPQKHLVRKGDLLFSRANTSELIGATAFVREHTENLVLPDKLWRFRWLADSPVMPEFTHALFSSTGFRQEIRRHATGTSGSMKNIGQKKVLQIEFGLPPLKLQKEFCTRMSAIMDMQTKAHREAELLGKLWKSLQQRAFHGDL